MDGKTNLEAKLPSRHVTGGPARAPYRSYCYGMGLTKAARHRPRIAHAHRIAFDLLGVAEVFKRTPYVADLKPGGRYIAKDMYEVGEVPLLMKTLLDHGFLRGECMTVTGRTVTENPKRVKRNEDQDVVRPADRPLSATSGVVGLRGNLAPVGAIVKVAEMAGLRFTGPARCFDGEEACFEAVKKKYREGDVRAIRYLRVRAVTHPGAAVERMCHADI